MRTIVFVVAVTNAVLVTLGAEDYDDSRRVACSKATGALPLLEAIGLEHVENMEILELEKGQNHTTFQTTFQDYDSFPAKCKAAEGVFVPFSGVFECQQGSGSTSLNVYKDGGDCFSPDPACQHYVDNPIDWAIDTSRLFNDVCTKRNETIEQAYESILATDTPLPSGESTFVHLSTSYDDQRRRQCYDSMKSFLRKNKELEDEALYHAQHTQIELLLLTPVLTQREYYNNEDPSRLSKYEQLCAQANGLWDTVSGTLDCMDVGGGKKTMVVQDSATCVPPVGCEDYTMEQYKIDSFVELAKQSCTWRDTGNTETTASKVPPASSTAATPTASNSFTGSKTKTAETKATPETAKTNKKMPPVSQPNTSASELRSETPLNESKPSGKSLINKSQWSVLTMLIISAVVTIGVVFTRRTNGRSAKLIAVPRDDCDELEMSDLPDVA